MLRVAVDTETTGRNVWTGARPFAVSMAWPNGKTYYWEWDVDPLTRQPIPNAKHARQVQKIVGDRRIAKCFFNAKFDIFMLEAIGIDVRGRIEEVSFKARSCYNLEPAYKLKPLAKKYCEIEVSDEKELHAAVVLARRLAKKLGGFQVATKETHGDKPILADFWLPAAIWRLYPKEAKAAGLPRDVCKRYAVQDAVRTIELDTVLSYGMRELDKEDDRLRVVELYEREMQLLPTTMDMERRGVTIDEKEMERLWKECADEVRKAQAAINKASSSKGEVNINSTQQVAAVLFNDRTGLKPRERTKTGQPKTGSEALAPYRQHPLVKELLRYRGNDKAIKSFFQAYANLAERTSEGHLVLHPGYHQCGALTNRYTCAEPNLQQVSDPTTTNSRAAEYVVNVRRVFTPPPGKIWFAPDYDQVEVIIFADISGEPTMLQAIKDGIDIHTATTNKIWGGEDNPKAVPAIQRALGLKGLPTSTAEAIARLRAHDWDIVAAEAEFEVKLHRKLSKSTTFTKVFGGGVNALMAWIGCTDTEAREILRDYDRSFPEMRRRMKEIEAEGYENGYVVNRFGRRLAIDKWYAYRGVNYVVQSTAADLMKNGMIECDKYLKEIEIDARIAMTVHDELIFEFARQHAFKPVLRNLCKLMSDHGGRLSVPTPVSMDKIVARWSDKDKVSL